jgi:hypothetical protein
MGKTGKPPTGRASSGSKGSKSKQFLKNDGDAIVSPVYFDIVLLIYNVAHLILQNVTIYRAVSRAAPRPPDDSLTAVAHLPFCAVAAVAGASLQLFAPPEH